MIPYFALTVILEESPPSPPELKDNFYLYYFFQFVIIESVVSAIVDDYPKTLRKHKTLVTFAACVVGYLLGLICVTNVSSMQPVGGFKRP